MPDKKYPEIVVGALIFNSKNELLLIQSHKWNNQWACIGGHLELGEKVNDAIKREVKEETGLKIKNIQSLGWDESIFSKSFYKSKHFIFLDFFCQSVNTKVILNKEAEKYQWISIKESFKLNLVDSTRELIKKYQDKI